MAQAFLDNGHFVNGRPWLVRAVDGELTCVYGSMAQPSGGSWLSSIRGWSPVTGGSQSFLDPMPGVFRVGGAGYDARGVLWIGYGLQEGADVCCGAAAVLEDGRVQDMILSRSVVGAPALTVCENGARLFWVSEGADGLSSLQAADLAVGDTGLSCRSTTLVPAQPAPLYRPTAVVLSGGRMLVAWECLRGTRYLLELLEWDGSTVLRKRSLDLGVGNNLAPSLAVGPEGEAYVAWESSQPLESGYEVLNTVIPGFGHGWQVRTRMGLGRFRDGVFEVLDHAGTPGHVLPGAQESSGVPRVLVTEAGSPVIAYLEVYRAAPRVGWRVRLATPTVDGWSEHEAVDAFQRERTTPVAVSVPGQNAVDVLGFANTSEGVQLDLGRAVLPGLHPVPDWAAAELAPASPPAFRGQPRRGATRAVAEVDGRECRLYWGDLHSHSNLSPCSLHPAFHCGEVEDKYRYEKDVGALDFAVITDHERLLPVEWRRTELGAEAACRPGRFVTFNGFEWTSSMQREHANYGHHCVVYRDRGPLLPCHVPGSDTPEGLWSRLTPGQALTIPHHPSDGTHPFDWDHWDPRFVRLVEIFQVRGAYESDDTDMHPTLYGRTTVPGRSVQHGLARGYRFGFTSGGEHEGVGVTAVWAPALTREALFDALHRRCTYGTTGARIELEFRVNGAFMGTSVPALPSAPVSVRFRVRGTAALSEVSVIRNGEAVFSREPGGTVSMEETWTDPQPCAPGVWYYLRVRQADGEAAWSSPVFFVDGAE